MHRTFPGVHGLEQDNLLLLRELIWSNKVFQPLRIRPNQGNFSQFLKPYDEISGCTAFPDGGYRENGILSEGLLLQRQLPQAEKGVHVPQTTAQVCQPQAQLYRC